MDVSRLLSPCAPPFIGILISVWAGKPRTQQNASVLSRMVVEYHSVASNGETLLEVDDHSIPPGGHNLLPPV